MREESHLFDRINRINRILFEILLILLILSKQFHVW